VKQQGFRSLVSIASLGIALLLTGAWWLFRRAVYVPSAPPAPVASPAPRPVVEVPADAEAVVESIEGSVQRSNKGAWAVVTPGDRLHVDDSVRTAPGARADLRIGEKSHITVAQGSQLAIRELTEKVHRFKLARGHVHVDYEPDGQRVLKIEGEGEDGALAETRGAKFSVLSTGRSIAIATDAGAVDLKAKGQTVVVAAGQQALVAEGAPPTPARAIPPELWLKVANALPTAPMGTCAEVRGSAPSGSEVTVDGKPVDLDAEGSFSVRVPRERHRDSVTVATRDASGRTTTQRVPCADQVGDADDVALRWGKKGGG
jgi:FecR protein